MFCVNIVHRPVSIQAALRFGKHDESTVRLCAHGDLLNKAEYIGSVTMFLLKPNCQNYAWGKVGSDSEVAKLCFGGDSEFPLAEDQPYAELWMGTHPKGPALVKQSGETLAKWLAGNPAVMGKKFAAKHLVAKNSDGLQLPFLFKVLSVQKALSIQTHPNKAEAKKLHQVDPGNYPDDNHKPEMAIALTPFELMCGFRPAAEILTFITEIPELFEMMGTGNYESLSNAVSNGGTDEQVKRALRHCFHHLMVQPEPLVKRSITGIVERISLRHALAKDQDDKLGDLVVRLHQDFPGDIGCFAPFFLNHFTLQPGEAVFLGPNEPHAYLYGDCMECMASSDNVIRAGLTPKFKDVERLCQMLTYRTGGVEENKFQPYAKPDDNCVIVYKPPVPEFIVLKMTIPPNTTNYQWPVVNSCGIVIVISGEAKFKLPGGDVQLIHRGHVAFTTAEADLIVAEVVKGPFVAYMAYCDDANADLV